MKNKSLFSELKREFNETLSTEFRIRTIIKNIGDQEKATYWKLSNNNPFYRIRNYTSYLYKSKLLTRKKRGVYELNHGIPDWLTVTGLEFLVGYNRGKDKWRGMTKKELHEKIFTNKTIKEETHPLVGRIVLITDEITGRETEYNRLLEIEKRYNDIVNIIKRD